MSTNKTKKRKKRCPNGAIRQTSNGTFVGRVPMGFTGERYVYKIVTGKSKADVKNQVEQLKLKFNGVEITEESLMTLSSWMDYWLEEIKKPMISYTTYDNYRSFIDKHINPLLGFKKLIRITREDIIRFIERLQSSYTYAHFIHSSDVAAAETIDTIFYNGDQPDTSTITEPPKKKIELVQSFRKAKAEMERLGIETYDEYLEYLEFVEATKNRGEGQGSDDDSEME